MSLKKILVKGGRAKSFLVNKGEYIKIIDVEGKQVADLVAFHRSNNKEYVSTAHTRTMNGNISIRKGSNLYSNGRNVFLQLIEDTVGVHDTLYPCCDPMRYKLDFNMDDHRNCRENFAEVLEPYCIDYWDVPDPVNLFQNAPINKDGSFGDIDEPKSRAGDYVVFEALCDMIVAISACPMDVTPLCGWKITDIMVQVSEKRGMIG